MGSSEENVLGAMFTERIDRRRMVAMFRTLVVTAALTLGGCAATLAYTPVPEAASGRAQVAGYSNIRTWGDANAHEMDVALNLKDAAPAALPRAYGRGEGPPVRSYLALSSGAGNGAYGAGLLVGWTASGERPVFDVVTGVSTGALEAPFAFLGPAYDEKLKEVYTQFETRDLGAPQIFSAVFGGPSLVDASGLEQLLVHYVDSDLLAEVAREHARGRRLLVATTNMEAERQVIWNLGAIAASKNPDRLELFRRILLASAAIPGVLPPVLIRVTVDGREFQEMHADGGTVQHVFFLPHATRTPLEKDAPAQERLYVIYHGKIRPEWQSIEPTSFKIAARSLGLLIKSQARGDVERLYAQAKSDGISFRLAAIPDNFGGTSEEPFDKAYMRRLFDLGYAEASQGYPWAKAPPR
jgi:hypothetical protein